MKKVYKSYFSRDPDPGWRWPGEITGRFESRSFYGMSPGYYFEPDSVELAEFVELADRLRLELIEEDLVSVSGKDVAEYPYYQLIAKADKDYQKPEYMDWTDRCPGDEKTLCRVGGRQHRKIVLDTSQSKDLDLMELPNEINPHIYIISKRLKDALETRGLTGYKTIPCADNTTDPETLDLEDSDLELEVRAERFQLIVTARPNQPPHVGRVVIRRRCETCGTVYLFMGGGTPWFAAGDPAQADFQVYRSYASENEGTFDIAGEVCLVSGRFIEMMQAERFTGLGKHSTKPSIPHCVVPVR